MGFAREHKFAYSRMIRIHRFMASVTMFILRPQSKVLDISACTNFRRKRDAVPKKSWKINAAASNRLKNTFFHGCDIGVRN